MLDEPINGLDADGMRIMREILTDLTQNKGCTVLISSHILSELEKIATHYGIIRGGRMLQELTAQELNARCRTFVALQADGTAVPLLQRRYPRVCEQDGFIRVYDADAEEVAHYLYTHNIVVRALQTNKVSLEEYYTDVMHGEVDHATRI